MEVEVCGGGTGKLKGNEGLVRDGMSGVKVGGKKVEGLVSQVKKHQENGLHCRTALAPPLTSMRTWTKY